MGNCGECMSDQNESRQKNKQNGQQYNKFKNEKGSQYGLQSEIYDSERQTMNDGSQGNMNNLDKSNMQIQIINENPDYDSNEQQITQKKKISVDDFDMVKVLGRGSFGKVLLVSRKSTGKLYAMKILKKGMIAQKNQVLHTKSERAILQNMNSPFIVQLHFAFQSADKLYFVMDFMIGGELFFHLRRAYKFNEERSKLYSAELIAAIDYLHTKHVIYRDLKPENILLGADGHLKIADFGLSKQGVSEGVKTNTFCGTPEYLAPEILLGKGHDKSVDWYSLGCLLYEMLSGAPPFYSKDRHKMFRNRLEKPIEMRTWFSPEAISIIKGLLQKDPTKRLGYNGTDEIKNHPFFAEMNWNKLLAKKYPPPFKPKVQSKNDLRHFDKMFTGEKMQETPPDGQEINQKGGHQNYEGFTMEGGTLAHQSLRSNNSLGQNGIQPRFQQQQNQQQHKQNQNNNINGQEQQIDEEDDQQNNSQVDNQTDLQDNNLIEVNNDFSLKPKGLGM